MIENAGFGEGPKIVENKYGEGYVSDSEKILEALGLSEVEIRAITKKVLGEFGTMFPGTGMIDGSTVDAKITESHRDESGDLIISVSVGTIAFPDTSTWTLKIRPEEGEWNIIEKNKQ